MSTTAYPHLLDDCDSCRAFDADLTIDVLDTDGVRVQRSRWCEHCAGPLMAKLVLQSYTLAVAAPDAPRQPETPVLRVVREPCEESAAAVVRRRRAEGKTPSTWTVDYAEEVLRHAQPSASTLLRALVDEGGSATAARLKELTGQDRLNPMMQTLNGAARRLWIGPLPDDETRLFIAQPRRDPAHPRVDKVHSYELRAEHVALWDEALRRLGR